MTHVTNKLSHAHAPENFKADVAVVQKKLGETLEKIGIDVAVISAQDAFLSEYNVLANSQRYALSGFTGSTGDGVFFAPQLSRELGRSASFVLFVDGRYHIQADKECQAKLVDVVKFGVNDAFQDPPVDWLKRQNLAKRTVAIDGQRTSWKRYCDLKNVCAEQGHELRVLGGNDISGPLELPGWKMNRPIVSLGENTTGRSLVKNLKAVWERLPEGVNSSSACFMTCASDDAAWLLNARGFHMPCNSSFLAYTFSCGNNVVVFLPEGVHESGWEVENEVGVSVRVVRGSVAELDQALRAFGNVQTLLFLDRASNAWTPTFAQKIWPQARMVENFDAVVVCRAQKTEKEKAIMRDAHLRSSRAIARTLRWLKSAHESENLSEATLSQRITEEYAAEGALELSFSTIAATGANGAIVHYGGANDANKIINGEIVLLDSGAYYKEGYATDCTRAAFRGMAAGVLPQPWQKEIYTVTLKAFVADISAVFPSIALGSHVDILGRNVCRAHGYDFGHGTGHGIGIHVHEGGLRISPAAAAPLVEHGAVSVEPGIYLEGKGGVRLENIVFVQCSQENPGYFVFENIMWVGFDWDLIDLGRLTEQEKQWLRLYEGKCAALGTTVTSCPL
jgi:Xaa-Pro aminopeptidase